MMDKIKHFEMITDKLRSTYESKNHDYGDSFNELLDMCGISQGVGQLYHKVKRALTLSNNPKEARINESLYDTLGDLANYAIMCMMWLDKNNPTKEHINIPFETIPEESKRTPDKIFDSLVNSCKDKINLNFHVGYKDLNKTPHFHKSSTKELYTLNGRIKNVERIMYTPNSGYIKINWVDVTGCKGSNTMISYYPLNEIYRFWK